jgi:hypothetical protein
MGNHNHKSYDVARNHDEDFDCDARAAKKHKIKRPLSECFGFNYNFNLIENDQDDKVDKQPKRSNTIQLINYKTSENKQYQQQPVNDDLEVKIKKEKLKFRKLFGNRKQLHRAKVQNTQSHQEFGAVDWWENKSTSATDRTGDRNEHLESVPIVRSLTDYNIKASKSENIDLEITTKSDTDDDAIISYDHDGGGDTSRFSNRKRKQFTKSPALYNIHEITQQDSNNMLKISDLIEHNDYNVSSYKPAADEHFISSDSFSCDYDDTVNGDNESTITSSTPLKLLKEVNRKLIDYQYEHNEPPTPSSDAKFVNTVADSDIEMILNDFGHGNDSLFFDRNFDKLSTIMLNLTLINVIAPLAISECTTLNNSVQDLRMYNDAYNDSRFLSMQLTEAF